MARATQRTQLILSTEQRNQLEKQSNSRKGSLREIQRAKVLLHYADGVPIAQIQRLVQLSRPSIYKCIDKALAAGPQAGLKDYYHRPFDPLITQEAKPTHHSFKMIPNQITIEAAFKPHTRTIHTK